MFDRILVPHDGSPAADAAMPWVNRLPAQAVRLLRVEPDLGPAIEELSGLGPDGARVDDAAEARAELDRAAKPLTDAGRRVETTVVVGDDPAEAILAEAAAAPADLIAMATHGRGAVGRLLLGGVADRIARHSPVPVLLVRPENRSAAVARVVVPLDGSDRAETALPLARRLADELGAPLHLVRAIDDLGIVNRIRARREAGDAQPDDAWDRARTDLEADAHRYLHGISANAEGGAGATTEVATGTPAFALREAIRPDDLVVMTSHGAGGMRRWLIGSVADKLVREAPGPVLLVPARAVA